MKLEDITPNPYREFHLIKVILFIMLCVITTTLNAYPIDSDGNMIIPPKIHTICTAYSHVTEYVYANRQKHNVDELLDMLRIDWQEYAKNDLFTHSHYLDLQRIIRDAYRVNENTGEYKRKCCTPEIIKEHTTTQLGQCVAEELYPTLYTKTMNYVQ